MLLPWLILLPFIGAVLSGLGALLHPRLPRWIAAGAMGLTLLLTLQLWLHGNFALLPVGDHGHSWQSQMILPWIPRFGISIHLAVDGLSVLMVVLTALLGLLAVLASWREERGHNGLFFLNVLWMLGGVMGVFLAIDLFLFFFFWEMMLVPMYFLIALWGHRGSDKNQHVRAATKFFIYTQTSGLIMLVAILALALCYHQATGAWSFDYTALLGLSLPYPLQYVLMLGFFIAFAVKMPIVPVHGWLADAHSEAPTAGAVDMTGILLKTAAYGMLRFSLPLFPQASHDFAPIAMTLGVIGIFYGAWLAYKQTDIKRLVAYTTVSHMGFVMIAIYSGSVVAYQGAVMQMIAHGLSAAGLFLLSGLLYNRLQTRDLREMGGLWGRLRYLPAFTLFFAVATLGMPGTGNFVGEFLMLIGSYPVVPVYTVIATFGLVFASVYALVMVQRACFGPAKSTQPLPGLSVREGFLSLLLAVLVVACGVYPQPILNTSQAAMESIQHLFSVSLSTTRP